MEKNHSQYNIHFYISGEEQATRIVMPGYVYDGFREVMQKNGFISILQDECCDEFINLNKVTSIRVVSSKLE